MKKLDQLKEEIASYEQEISNLEEELERTTGLDDSTYHTSGLSTFTSPSIQRLTKQREILKRLTDVDITSVYKSSQSSENVQQIKGTIRRVSFCLKFTTEGEENSPDSADIRVKNLSIKLEDTEHVPEHIKTFVARCENSCCIKDFFQGFASYCHRCEERTKTFEYFSKKYSQITSWIRDDHLIHAQTKNETYTISWENFISDALISHPVLDLYITTSSQGDPAVHNAVSIRFQEMIEKHGIEAAIDTLLMSL